MRFRIVFIAIVLTLPASIALACSQHSQQTQSCSAGTVWDSNAQKCTKQVSG
ncbi:hypothetical protein [Parasedimentitalea maritima]|uniref:Chitin-binding type-2 domain-containing protein n=1 Tax=Parasedimentitalea maritima TaxID=2578117 RepID=A0A6A4RJK3_9RHOB|nr:hypothetical protein [Zongyanglinia marina]KAE9631565.1 hypothetical protein GP644_04395 [Zongyanglinia marina]